MHEDSLRESAKLIIDRMPNPERWAEGDIDKAFRIAQELGGGKQKKSCNACSLKVANYLRSQIGYPIINQEEPQYKKRLAICKECPKLIAGVTCSECSCFVHIKSRFKSMKCPIDKW